MAVRGGQGVKQQQQERAWERPIHEVQTECPAAAYGRGSCSLPSTGYLAFAVCDAKALSALSFDRD